MVKKTYVTPTIESEILELPKAKAGCVIMKANTSKWYFQNGENYQDYDPTYYC